MEGGDSWRKMTEERDNERGRKEGLQVVWCTLRWPCWRPLISSVNSWRSPSDLRSGRKIWKLTIQQQHALKYHNKTVKSGEFLIKTMSFWSRSGPQVFYNNKVWVCEFSFSLLSFGRFSGNLLDIWLSLASFTTQGPSSSLIFTFS